MMVFSGALRVGTFRAHLWILRFISSLYRVFIILRFRAGRSWIGNISTGT